MKMDKFAIRQDMKHRRGALSPDEVLTLSRAIADRLFACKEFLACRDILFYLSFGNEVYTDEMITRSLENHQRVYVPRRVAGERRLEVCEITDMDQEFELGAYGIREPVNSSVSPSIIDAVITPGLAFDRSGGRIGFGGGYFDWFLKQSSALRVGVAYGFQIMDSVPQDPWDERVQIIFADNDTINC